MPELTWPTVPVKTSATEQLDIMFKYATPYAAQKSMMWRIVAALENKQNCLVESPTGSGKTMSYLCSAVAWLQKHDKRSQTERIKLGNAQADLEMELMNGKLTAKEVEEKNDKLIEDFQSVTGRSRIWIGTRTHQQIGQIVKELKESPYNGYYRVFI